MNWIKLNDKLPEERQKIMAYGIPMCTCGSDPIIKICEFEKGNFIFGEYDCMLDATHWMPLPELPIN